MKKIKGLILLGLFALFGIGSSFGDYTYSVGVLRTSIYNTNISDSKNITSKNYYAPASFKYVGRSSCKSEWIYYGYGIYDTFSSFTFNYNSGLNNNYYLHNNNGVLESLQWYLGGCNSAIDRDPTFSDASYFNYGYTNSIFNGSVSFIPRFSRNGSYPFPDGYYLGWGNSGGNSISSSSSQYVHLYYNVGVSDFSYNPGIIDGSVDILHYLYWDGKKIYSDYGYYSDVPDGYTRKKLFENLNSTYSYIAVPDSYDVLDSSNIEFFSSYGPVFWSFNESNNSYHIYPSLTGGYLLLNFIDYESDTLTGNSTLVLQLSGDSIIYNFYYNYSPFIQQLDLNNPLYKGYLTSDGSSSSAFNLFVAFLTDNGFYFDSIGSFQNGLTLRSYRYGNQSTNQYGDYHFDFVESSDIPVIIPGGGNGNQSFYSGSVSLNNCIDTQICYDYTGSQGHIIRMCTTKCVSSGVIASGGYIGSDGTYYFVNSPISIEDSLKTDNPENMFTGSYIDSGGILSLSYFTDYFQPGAKKIGVCPFKYYEGPLDFMTKLQIGDVYLLMPVLCFYSAFQQGKNVSFFDQYDVNDGLFSQSLLYGESDNHKLLFAFFDVLFSIGLLGLIRYLSRHLF